MSRKSPRLKLRSKNKALLVRKRRMGTNKRKSSRSPRRKAQKLLNLSLKKKSLPLRSPLSPSLPSLKKLRKSLPRLKRQLLLKSSSECFELKIYLSH